MEKSIKTIIFEIKSMTLNNIKLLIIPDVHGRTFWRQPVQEVLKTTDVHIVFLGDYVDPYYPEGITPEMAYGTLVEIIELKQEYPERITLLQGNHDAGYSISTDICTCRRDRIRATKISELFIENESLFDLAYETEINGKKFYLSHGGLTNDWLDVVKSEFPYVTGSAESLNKYFHDEKDVKTLSMVSSARGGWDACASILWASAVSDTSDKTVVPGYIHIVGHTQLVKPIKYADNLYYVDAREAIYIDDEGSVRKYADNQELELIN